MFIHWLLFSIGAFIIFRLLSFYSKSYWRNDLLVAVAQGFIISLMMIFIYSGNNQSANRMADHQSYDFLEGIYSYEYNSIEPGHKEEITNWLNDPTQDYDKAPIKIYSIVEDNQGYEYISAKGYKELEITFVYSVNDPNSKGQLHIAGIEGNKNDMLLVKVKYDRRYVLGEIFAGNSRI